ncbi:MAG: hypothetical protein K2Q21_07600 [Chitinophagaceae bacterium]|nr:hypothetical protein [Chitinophagaceae bacterium]
MTQPITYKTSSFSDNYQILKDSLQIGKLYKTEWLGSTIDSTLNEQKFRFVSKGLLKPTITILNLSTNKIVGTIKIKHLRFHQNAILTLPNGVEYNWTCNKIFANDWQWIALNSGETLFTSKEPLDLFKQNGTISFSDKTLNTELFITLGIHLRNVVRRKSHFIKLIGALILIILLQQLFI